MVLLQIKMKKQIEANRIWSEIATFSKISHAEHFCQAPKENGLMFQFHLRCHIDGLIWAGSLELRVILLFTNK